MTNDTEDAIVSLLVMLDLMQCPGRVRIGHGGHGFLHRRERRSEREHGNGNRNHGRRSSARAALRDAPMRRRVSGDVEELLVLALAVLSRSSNRSCLCLSHEDGMYTIDVIVFGGNGKTIELVERGQARTLGHALRLVLWRLSKARVGDSPS